jgi:hypothetical protein
MPDARSRHDRSRRTARLLAAALAIVAALGLFELPALVGLIDYRNVFKTPGPSWLRPGNDPDPDLIYVRRGPRTLHLRVHGNEADPDATDRRRVYEVSLHYDRDGFRNSDEFKSASVIVIGDSFIEGVHVIDRDLLTTRLANVLQMPVVNLGRSGYGPQQECHVLRRFGLPLRPRACVWAFYEGNDLDEADLYEAHRQILKRAMLGGPMIAFDRSFAKNVWLYLARSWPCREVATTTFPALTGRFVGRSGAAVTLSFASPDQIIRGSNGTARADSPGFDRVRAALNEAYRLCRSRRIALTVVFIPAKYRVYRDLCSIDRAPPAVDDLPRALGDAVAGIAPEIGYLDLTPRFRSEAARGALLYLPDDTHWSAAGHRVAALEVADAIGRADRPRSHARRGDQGSAIRRSISSTTPAP